MFTRVLTFSFILTSLFVIKDVCQCSCISDMCGESCSHVYDPVCGEATALNGRSVLKIFHNICHFNKISCWLMNMGNYNIEQVADIECGIELQTITRRVHDFSIVGAHQACNHSCPTFCLDIYDPACAQIWAPNMQTYEYKPMINHCHIDLFSCVMGVNVTVQPLIGKCYQNPSALNFMFNVASLKSLKLLSYSDTRRSNSGSRMEIEEFTDLLQMLL